MRNYTRDGGWNSVLSRRTAAAKVKGVRRKIGLAILPESDALQNGRERAGFRTRPPLSRFQAKTTDESLYCATVRSFFTDLTPFTRHAFQDALALFMMVSTSPVSETTPALVFTAMFECLIPFN